MKIRTLPKNNYRGILVGDKTIRIAIDPKKPITELEYPEFYDVKITDKCDGACPYCYMGSLPCSKHGEQVPEKLRKLFGQMSQDEKPFQIALGGGNPNEHPQFIEILRTLKEDLDIMPNYTTNGMGLTPDIIDATKQYCGGVAISTHPHLADIWRATAEMLTSNGIRTNFHIIISDKESVDEFIKIREEYSGKIDYFVLLAYKAQGRAKEKQLDYDYLFEYLRNEVSVKGGIDDVAFGAMFYEELSRKENSIIPVSIYEPEAMSKYIDLVEMTIHPSSFDVDTHYKGAVSKILYDTNVKERVK